MTYGPIEIQGATEIPQEELDKKPLVCCSTCHNKPCTPDMKKVCFRETTAFLWWNERLGYFPKMHEKYLYAFWQPPKEGFIKRKEFSV